MVLACGSGKWASIVPAHGRTQPNAITECEVPVLPTKRLHAMCKYQHNDMAAIGKRNGIPISSCEVTIRDEI